LLWADVRNLYVWIVLLSIVGFGLVGFIDDYIKVSRERSEGLTVLQKFAAQIGIALSIGLFFYTSPGYSTELSVPFFKAFTPDLGTFYIPFAILVIVGCSNAVNLTDGLDGLASGLMVIASGAFTVLAYLAGHQEFARYLDIAPVPQAAELTIFCGSMVGASLAFLWYNAHPAEIFMGDVGSLGLGGALGTVAVLIKQEILLLFVGGVFVLEALSVIIQVVSFKLSGRRIFRMAPLHHHFEALGWPESKIIARFWILGLVWSLLALSTLKLR
jgi:phospho-N-acetylmuramoyl-pentapeptide-transferase